MARMEASRVSRWSGKQEVAGACAGVRRPRACAYWREEEGDRGEVEMGWAVLGQVSGRQVSGWASLFLYFCSVFYLIATEFKFKQIENSAKTPLDIFKSLNGLLHT